MNRADHNALMCAGLVQPFRSKVEQWLIDCDKVMQGIWLCDGLRTAEQQFNLFKEGRNMKADGTWIVVDQKKVVTNARGVSDGPHPRGAAVDFAPWLAGKLAWTREDLFRSAAALAKRRGIAWGGDWKGEQAKKLGDLGHLEDPMWRAFKIPGG